MKRSVSIEERRLRFREVVEPHLADALSLARWLTDSATELLVKHGYDESYGARPLKRSIQKYIEDPLSDKILLGEFSRGDEIEVDASADGTRLDFKVLSSASKA